MKDNFIQERQTALFNELGLFWAFSTEQFREGLEKVGGTEKRGKYVSVGSGGYCPKSNVTALHEGLAKIKADWQKERQKADQVRLVYVGIDNWNRPVWKAPDQDKAYYGSVNELFDCEATEAEVLKKVDTYGLCYMGEHFGCEPMGSSVPDQYFI